MDAFDFDSAMVFMCHDAARSQLIIRDETYEAHRSAKRSIASRLGHTNRRLDAILERTITALAAITGPTETHVIREADRPATALEIECGMIERPKADIYPVAVYQGKRYALVPKRLIGVDPGDPRGDLTVSGIARRHLRRGPDGKLEYVGY